MYVSAFFILVIEVLEVSMEKFHRLSADRHSSRHFLARGRVIERVAFARPSLRTSSSRCATWTSCACCGTTATARPARDRPRKRRTSPPRRWTTMRAPGKTRARPRRRETRTPRCAMRRVSTDTISRARSNSRDTTRSPTPARPPRLDRPARLSRRSVSRLYARESLLILTRRSPPRRLVASRTPTPRTAERSCFSTRPLLARLSIPSTRCRETTTTPKRRFWKPACFPIAR